MFETDGWEYNILKEGIARSVGNEHSLFCEIGTRKGGSTKIIIDQINSVCPDKTLICIDPYGDIAYETKDNIWTKYDYTNEMRRQTQKDLFSYVFDKRIDFHMLIMEDQEYFHRFADGYPTYNDTRGKVISNHYQFVYFDGPHAAWPIMREVDFFLFRVSKGSVFVFDDICEYNHDIIDDHLIRNYWEVLEKGEFKASYIKL